MSKIAWNDEEGSVDGKLVFILGGAGGNNWEVHCGKCNPEFEFAGEFLMDKTEGEAKQFCEDHYKAHLEGDLIGN